MSGIISSIKKSSVFDADNPFVVCVFRKNGTGSNKLQKAALSESSAYSCTYNLSMIYEGKDYTDNEGNFLANKAFKDFKAEFPIGYVDKDINLYDIPVSEICGYDKLLVRATKNEMSTCHPACYGDREQARQLAKRMVAKGLESGVFKVVDDDDDDDDEDDDE